MNLELIGQLVGLRYKLLWAKTRSRNGKIALFFAGYLLLVMVISLLAAGGFGAGVQAVRSGHATTVAAVVLGGVYVQALLAAVVLGFGMNAIFAEGELRRYPLKSMERRAARHLIGILDPFWFLFLALELGLVFALYAMGAGSLLLGLAAVLVLFVSNYLMARVLALLVDRLIAKKGGSMILLVSVMFVGFVPSLLVPKLQKSSPAVAMMFRGLKHTPPAVAAVAVTHGGTQFLSSFAVLLVWALGLTAALVALERRPPKARAVQTTKVSWEGPFERIGRLFGGRNGPLITQWLRFYSRNNRFRTIYPLALPLAAFLIFVFTHQKEGVKPLDPFVSTLGAFGVLGFVGTGQFAVNQFGYVKGGLRRYLLLPLDSAAAFRAGSFTFLLLSGALIPVGALGWMAFSPLRGDARALAMLVGCSLTTLFLFHGLALWTSLLAPRRGNYTTTFGNDLSFAANIVMIGGMMAVLFGPRAVSAIWPGTVTPAHWWVLIPMAAAAAAFYVGSLRLTTGMFRSRREQLVSVVEGKG